MKRFHSLLGFSLFSVSVALFSATLFVADTAVAGPNCSKNPDHPKCGGGSPPPPPPIDGSACAAHADFPALAYEIETIENEGKRQERRTYDVYLANSDASCSVLVHSGDAHMVQANSYRQVGQRGVILNERSIAGGRKNQCLGTEIIGLSFDVVDNAVTTPLPLGIDTIYQYQSCPGGIFHPVLSPDGSEIYFGTEVPSGDPENPWLDTLEMIDLDTCSPPVCIPQVLFSAYGRPVTWLSVSESGNRIFMNTDDRSDGTYGIMVMERDSSGAWGSPKYVVNNWEAGYSLARFGGGPTDVTNWAYDGTLHEVLVFPREEEGMPAAYDIFDVGDCDVSIAGTTCIGDGSVTVLHQAIPGWAHGFTSYGSVAESPNLYTIDDFTNIEIEEVDLATLTWIRTLLPGDNTSSLDSAH